MQACSGQPDTPGSKNARYTISWRRPSNRSSRLALPFGPSNSYSLSTASHGIRRRSAASASRARVNAFSLTSSSCRADSHSSGDTIGGVFIAGSPSSASSSRHLSEDEVPQLATFEASAGLRVCLRSAGGDLHRRELVRLCAAVHREPVKDVVPPRAGGREHDASAVDTSATCRSGPERQRLRREPQLVERTGATLRIVTVGCRPQSGWLARPC